MNGDFNLKRELHKQKAASGICTECGELKSCNKMGVFNHICNDCLEIKRVFKEKKFYGKKKKW